MYICCVLDGNIHIFTTTQRDDPYQISVYITIVSLCNLYSYRLHKGTLVIYNFMI